MDLEKFIISTRMNEPFLPMEERLTGVEELVDVSNPNEVYASGDELEMFQQQEKENSWDARRVWKFTLHWMKTKWYCILFIILYVSFSLFIYFNDWKREEFDSVTYKVCTITHNKLSHSDSHLFNQSRCHDGADSLRRVPPRCRDDVNSGTVNYV